MKTISALIITYNEEDNIEDCLNSVKWCNDIILVDSYSQDKTVEIASRYTDKIFLREFDDFSSQRNYALEKVNSDWVLVIDADERVTEGLEEEIKRILRSESRGTSVFEIPIKNHFLGKWIRHCGWYPDYTSRLFKVGNEFTFTGRVHEKIGISTKPEKLRNPIIHFTYRNIEHYMRKMNHYTSLWAADRHLKGKKTGCIYLAIRPIFEFLKIYIFKKGFLLGPQGLILSIILSYYTFLKYAKLWEKNLKI